jgi:dTMP kinase
MNKSFFITFEGPEGSGKTTQIQLLASHLRRQGRRVLVTREPGGTELALGIRKLLLNGQEDISPMAELFLYEADRAQHIHETLFPALKKGTIVLCDRYTDSTLAYQSYGRGLNKAAVTSLNRVATQGLMPDLTVLLDVPVERGLQLAKRKKKRLDRLERAGLSFHKRVRAGFLALAKEEPKRFRVIQQQATIEQTQNIIRQAIKKDL